MVVDNIAMYLIYTLIGLFFCYVLFLFNGMVISPMIILHYAKINKNPNKIVNWLIRKTNDSTLLMVGLMVHSTMLFYRKFIKNKIIRNG